MANEYKQCPNGHYYQGDSCPYCKSGIGHTAASSSSMKTEIFGGQTDDTNETYSGTQEPTMPFGGNVEKTQVFNGGAVNCPSNAHTQKVNSAPMSGRTCFGDEDEMETVSTPTGERIQRASRETRKLVGWLVSYTLDPLGVDFKLYEGRNIIGRDQDCNITVADNRVSSKHAVLLFRAGKYSLTDSQSSHGTFVNDRDIELEPCYLSDGDMIQVGQTIFKFRSAL